MHLLGSRGAKVFKMGAVLCLLPRLLLQPPHHLVPRLSTGVAFRVFSIYYVLNFISYYFIYIMYYTLYSINIICYVLCIIYYLSIMSRVYAEGVVV